MSKKWGIFHYKESGHYTIGGVLQCFDSEGAARLKANLMMMATDGLNLVVVRLEAPKFLNSGSLWGKN